MNPASAGVRAIAPAGHHVDECPPPDVGSAITTVETVRYTVDLLRAGEQAEGWHALHALHALEVFAGSDGRDWNRHRSIMELARTGT